jgi:hypothetical protein
MGRKGWLLVAGALVVLAGVFLWPKRVRPVREQVEQRCVQMLRAAEARDVGTLMGFISEGFRGADGSGRDELRGVLLHQLVQQSWVRIFMTDLTVDVGAPTRAVAHARFVFGRSEAQALRDLARDSVMSAWAVDADFAREKDGEWRVVFERHRALSPDELLSQP